MKEFLNEVGKEFDSFIREVEKNFPSYKLKETSDLRYKNHKLFQVFNGSYSKERVVEAKFDLVLIEARDFDQIIEDSKKIYKLGKPYNTRIAKIVSDYGYFLSNSISIKPQDTRAVPFCDSIEVGIFTFFKEK